MRVFKPRGLAIYALPLERGQLVRRYHGYFMTTGRTGSRARHLFSQLPDHRRQIALKDWVSGHSTEMTQ